MVKKLTFSSLVLLLLLVLFIFLRSVGNELTHALIRYISSISPNDTTKVLSYKPNIEKELDKYNLSEFTPVLLAIMYQESRGEGNDPMQASESAGLKRNEIQSPDISIRQGVLHFYHRMNLNQLQSLLRQSETFSIREVAFCYLEANGSISILKKTKYQKTTQEDFNMPIKPVYVPVTFIRDGEALWDELNDLGLDESWLKTQLTFQGISDYKDIFLAEWLENDGLFVQTY